MLCNLMLVVKNKKHDEQQTGKVDFMYLFFEINLGSLAADSVHEFFILCPKNNALHHLRNIGKWKTYDFHMYCM